MSKEKEWDSLKFQGELFKVLNILKEEYNKKYSSLGLTDDELVSLAGDIIQYFSELDSNRKFSQENIQNDCLELLEEIQEEGIDSFRNWCPYFFKDVEKKDNEN